MKPIVGVVASGCDAPLGYRQSCTLRLSINGSALKGDVVGGPVLCEQGNSNQCYQPSKGNQLHIIIDTTAAAGLLTAAGSYYSAFPVAFSKNGGQSWGLGEAPSVGNFSFTSTSCSGSGTSAVCTAAGNDNSGNPILYRSTNGGTNWSAVTTTPAFPAGLFNSTSCSGSGASAVCTAAGVDDSTSTPLLYQSTDGGVHWGAVTTTTNNSRFTSTSCSGSGASAVCTAAGVDESTNTPLLYQSTDGGVNWSPVTTTANIGYFNSTSSTGTNSMNSSMFSPAELFCVTRQKEGYFLKENECSKRTSREWLDR